MIEALDLCAVLKENSAYEELEVAVLLPVCRRALDRVLRNLKQDVDEDDPLIARTAAALARFELFTLCRDEAARFSGFKAGDITIQKDLQKEFQMERTLRDEALAEAAPILRDGGFFFAAS